METLTITIASENGVVLSQLWTDEKLEDVVTAIQDNVAVYDSEAELHEANKERDDE